LANLEVDVGIQAEGSCVFKHVAMHSKPVDVVLHHIAYEHSQQKFALLVA